MILTPLIKQKSSEKLFNLHAEQEQKKSNLSTLGGHPTYFIK